MLAGSRARRSISALCAYGTGSTFDQIGRSPHRKHATSTARSRGTGAPRGGADGRNGKGRATTTRCAQKHCVSSLTLFRAAVGIGADRTAGVAWLIHPYTDQCHEPTEPNPSPSRVANWWRSLREATCTMCASSCHKPVHGKSRRNSNG